MMHDKKLVVVYLRCMKFVHCVGLSVLTGDVCVIALFYATSKSVMTELFRGNVYSAADKIMVFLPLFAHHDNVECDWS